MIAGNFPENVVFRNFRRSYLYSRERADYGYFFRHVCYILLKINYRISCYVKHIYSKGRKILSPANFFFSFLYIFFLGIHSFTYILINSQKRQLTIKLCSSLEIIKSLFYEKQNSYNQTEYIIRRTDELGFGTSLGESCI